MIEKSLCCEFIKYTELIDGIGCYIPFITTIDYLSHIDSRKLMNIEINNYAKYKN